MKKYDISVIVPVYNVEEYLEECLNSILFNSDDITIQVICINDGSTDGSQKILEHYNNTYQNIIVIHQLNSGQSVARNVAIGKAIGTYIVFIDSDDFLEKNTLNKLYNHCIEFNLDVLDFNAYSTNNGVKKEYFNLKLETKKPILGELYFKKYIKKYKIQPFISPWSHMYKNSFIQKNKLLFTEGRLYEDIIFTVEAYLKAKKVMFIDLFVYNYRINNNSITRSRVNEKKIIDLNYIAKELSKVSNQYKIKVPMDNFFSGYKNFIINIILNNSDRELKKYLITNIFGDSKYYFFSFKNKFIYLLTKVNYNFFILYCKFIILVRRQNV